MPTDPRLDGGRGSDAGPRRDAGEYDAASPFPRDAGTVAEPIAEWTLRVDDSPVVEWLTLPESGAPYEIVARGDGPFAIEITLF
jgi:hypothetical protein